MMGCCLRIRPETLDLAQHLSGLRPSAPPTGKDSSEGQGDGSVPTLGIYSVYFLLPLQGVPRSPWGYTQTFDRRRED